MAFNKISLKFLIDDFNRRGMRPAGNLLTLSSYDIIFGRSDFNSICRCGGWYIEGDEHYEKEFNAKFVFKSLGFEHVDSMDISAYQGANIIHDLNNTNIPKDLENKYDYILDAGTIEHVFHFPNVLEVIYKMLKVGGTFIFETPIAYGLNHGYYNFSPILFFDYFRVNNYEINTILPYITNERGGMWVVWSVDPVINNIFDYVPFPFVEKSLVSMFGSVSKTSKTTFDVIPYQKAYADSWEKYNTILKCFKSTDKDTIYLYGTGAYARNLLLSLPEECKLKVAGLISQDTNEIGKMLYGYNVYALEEITKRYITIIIAAAVKFQNIIYERIKHLKNGGVKIIKID